MPRHRFILRGGVSAAAIVLGFVSTAAAQESTATSVPGRSAARDPFQVAEKAAESPEKGGAKGAVKKAEPEPEYVRKSLEEWMRILPRGVFEVTRLKATEPAFTGKYASGHFHGTFVCACCNAKLFSSDHKFESGTGWPSFWRPIDVKAIDRAIDNSEADTRIEVMCHRCGAHLGHVFDDGPPPTGLRFCINSLSLKLKQAEGDTARPATTTVKSRSKVKTARARSRTSSLSTRDQTKSSGSDAQGAGTGSSNGANSSATSKTGGG